MSLVVCDSYFINLSTRFFAAIAYENTPRIPGALLFAQFSAESYVKIMNGSH